MVITDRDRSIVHKPLRHSSLIGGNVDGSADGHPGHGFVEYALIVGALIWIVVFQL